MLLDETMKLVLGWTIVGLFIATGVLTVMSLVGLVRFVNPKQQHGLYLALIIEVVVGTVGGISEATRFNPKAVAEDVRTEGRREMGLALVDDLLATAEDEGARPRREQLLRIIDRIEVKRGTPQVREVARLRGSIERLPPGPIPRERAEELRRSDVLTRFRPPLVVETP